MKIKTSMSVAVLWDADWRKIIKSKGHNFQILGLFPIGLIPIGLNLVQILDRGAADVLVAIVPGGPFQSKHCMLCMLRNAVGELAQEGGRLQAGLHVKYTCC
uniref:Uncharacterized protein n=1 Tax=Zooxanthella nutricula TaxID=1333877 RepID=A0A7S2M9F1_9DINO